MAEKKSKAEKPVKDSKEETKKAGCPFCPGRLREGEAPCTCK